MFSERWGGAEPLSGDHYLKDQPREYVGRLAVEVRKGELHHCSMGQLAN